MKQLTYRERRSGGIIPALTVLRAEVIPTGDAAAWYHAPGKHIYPACTRRQKAIRVEPSRAEVADFFGLTDIPEKQRAIAGATRLTMCDDEGVPLICPTYQVFAKAIRAGDWLLLSWGRFRYFWLEPQLRAGSV